MAHANFHPKFACINAVVDIGVRTLTAFEKTKLYIEEVSIVDVETKNARHWAFGDTVADNTSLDSVCEMYPVDGEAKMYRSVTNEIINTSCNSKVLFSCSPDKCRILEQILHRSVYSLKRFGYTNTATSTTTPTTTSTSAVTAASATGHDGPRLKNQDAKEEKTCRPPVGKNSPHSRCARHRVATVAPDSACSLARALAAAEWCFQNPGKIDLRSAAVRKTTFSEWPADCPPPETMAENGFVSVECEDPTLTVCVYCGAKFHLWEKTDDVFSDHARYSPGCSLVERFRKVGRAIDMVEFRVIEFDS